MKIDYKTHKRVRLEDLLNFEYRYWGEGETLEEFIEYFTELNEAAKKAGVVKTMIDISVGDGYRDLDGWIPKTEEELEEERILQETSDNRLRERELKELQRLKEKYETDSH